VELIELLRQASAPVVWVLRPPIRDGVVTISTIDVIKDLVCQCLRLNIALHSESAVAVTCARFRAATSDEDWFDLLASVIANFPRLYLVVDIEAVDIAHIKSKVGWSWMSSFQAVTEKLAARNVRTQLKVLLVSYGSAALQEPNLASFKDSILSTRQPAPRSRTKWNPSSFAAGKARPGALGRIKGRDRILRNDAYVES